MLAHLATVAGTPLRLWTRDEQRWRLLASSEPHDAPSSPTAQALTPGAACWVGLDGHSSGVEILGVSDARCAEVGAGIAGVLQELMRESQSSARLSSEIAARYEEIDLLHSIGEQLGRATSINDVADAVLREIASVIGARRAVLRMLDVPSGKLRAVASIGVPPAELLAEVDVEDNTLLVAAAFRSLQVETGRTPADAGAVVVPIMHATAGAAPRAVGTIALADRVDGGKFTQPEAKLVGAVATQIGIAIENMRLVGHDRERLRVARELELAHNLQVRLMPTPAALEGEGDIALRWEAAESLGGDFYTFARLGRGHVGVMIGDVASHGFAAALIAAQVMAAAGIHSNITTPPDETLAQLRRSLASELENTDMYLTLFYGILEPTAGRLAFANAGHPHAFRIPATGPAQRLETTAPPLGLADVESFPRRLVPWEFGEDLLALFTDGLSEQPNAHGERFGEHRVIAHLEEGRHLAPADLVARVFDDVTAFGGAAADDRTLLIYRM